MGLTVSHLNAKAKERHESLHDSHLSSAGDKGKCAHGRSRPDLISK